MAKLPLTRIEALRQLLAAPLDSVDQQRIGHKPMELPRARLWPWREVSTTIVVWGRKEA